MNIFYTYARKSLRQNRSRTALTIIGIILSVAMLTAVVSIITSIQAYGVSYETAEAGGWHVKVCGVEWEDLQSLREDERVQEIYELSDIGYAYLEEGSNSYKPYLHFQAMNGGFSGEMPIHVTEGRMPEKEQEVLIPDHVADNGGVEFALGETFTVSVGKRTDNQGKGYGSMDALLYAGSMETDDFRVLESLDDEKEETYTVVGFYERPNFETYSAPGYTVLTVDGGKQRLDRETDCYVVMKHPKDAIGFWNEIQAEEKYQAVCNNRLLGYYGFSVREGVNLVLYGMGGILMVIIVVGAVALICNAFAISISERTRQFGLLISVGATRKQMKRTVCHEALLLGAVGIPVGILAGLAGIGLTLFAFRDAMNYLVGSREDIVLKLSVTPVALLLAAAVGMLTILISAYLPMCRALKMSAMDAIRQQKDIRLTAEKLKIPGWVERCFGLEGMIAWKNFRRNRKQYRATVFSLTLSILLFVSAGAFTEYLFGSFFDNAKVSSFDIQVTLTAENYEDVKNVSEQMENVTEAKLLHQYVELFYDVGLSGAPLTREAKNCLEQTEELSCVVQFLSDDDFEQVLEHYGLEKENYLNLTEPRAIVMNRTEDPTSENASEFLLLSENAQNLTLHKNQKSETTVLSIGDIVDNTLEDKMQLFESLGSCYWSDISYAIELVYPMSMLPELLESGVLTDNAYHGIFYFRADNHAVAAEKIEACLSDCSYFYLYDQAKTEEEMRTMLLMIQVFCFGFITLISLITATNIFNTIATNMNVRRREFAMLRSMGMTERGFAAMLDYECLIYGAKGLLYGLLTAVPITMLMYYFSHEKSMGGYFLPWRYIGIACICVFAVVYASMVYGRRKIKKRNIMEVLKEEL